MLINTALASETETISIQETEEIPSKPLFTESIFKNLAPMVLIFVVFYFLLIRPQEKKRRRQETLVKSVKVGEEVMTNTGMFGKITKINDSDNIVFLKIADAVEVKLLKTSIVDITSKNFAKQDKKVAKSSTKKANKKS